MITIGTYILLRLFNRERVMEGDEARHLATAKNFYKLWNKSFYDMHPPLYSWLCRFVPGTMVSLFCSIGLFLLAERLYTALGLTPPQKAIALVLITFNPILIKYSNRIMRYQLVALLGTGMIYLLSTHDYFLAGLVWGLLGLTCTFAGLRGFFIWLLTGPSWLTFTTFVVIFSSWFIQKAWVYSHNEWYPSGIEGKIEKVNPFTLKQLLSPFYFTWTYQSEGKRFLKWDFSGVKIPILLLLILLSLKDLRIGILTILLMQPLFTNRPNPRNFIIALPLVGFLLAKTLPEVPLQWLYFASTALLLGFLVKNRKYVSFPKIRAKKASEWISRLLDDGVMAEGLIAPFIALNTDKRVVIIPHERGCDVCQMLLAIQKFDIHWVVFSQKDKERYADYPAIDYIENNFFVITAIEEDDDVYYVYKVQKNFRQDKSRQTVDKSPVYRQRETRYN